MSILSFQLGIATACCWRLRWYNPRSFPQIRPERIWDPPTPWPIRQQLVAPLGDRSSPYELLDLPRTK